MFVVVKVRVLKVTTMFWLLSVEITQLSENWEDEQVVLLL